MSSKKQIRLTIPKWVADLKGWNTTSHLEFVPIVREDNQPINNKTVFVIKEVKKCPPSQ